jgi:hypothetical protein
MAHALDEVGCVADDELVCRLERLVKADRALSAKLLVHLGEVCERKLYLGLGYGSMFVYCRSGLGMSEAEAYLRLQAAKVGRRFPLVLERLGAGGLHLSAIKLLAPHLTEVNHAQLIDRVHGMTKREVEVLVAQLAPKPDVPARLRKLRAPRSPVEELLLAPQAAPAAAVSASTLALHSADATASHVAPAAPSPTPAMQSAQVTAARAVAAASSTFALESPHLVGAPPPVAAASTTFALQSPRTRASTAPLSPGRFKLELTLGQVAYDKLEQLRELLRHQNPSGDLTFIVERALGELLERTMKRRFAQTRTSKRQTSREQARSTPSVEREDTDFSPDVERKVVRVSPYGVSKSTRPIANAEGDTPPGPNSDSGRNRPGADAESDCTRPGHTAESDSNRAGTDAESESTRCETDADSKSTGPGTAIEREAGSRRSRYIPRAVVREVYARDAGQCTFVSSEGRRCAARGFLEVHHHSTSFARGGAATADNLRLTCREHNFFFAEQELGRQFMQQKLREAVDERTGLECAQV